MSGALSGRSLLWTIAAIFLITAVVGTMLQGVVAVGVLRPLETREAKARAELAASGIAAAIASAPVEPRGADLDSLLARRRAHVWPAWILYRSSDGVVVSAPPGRIPRGVVGPDSLRDARPDGRGGPEQRGRYEVIARSAVRRGAVEIGEVQVLRRAWPRGGQPFPGSRTSLLFLPIAIVASLLAGFVVVRLLVRRLRAMETLAARIAEGDLSVRIADRSGDEIGRLAEQLDRMAEGLATTRGQLEANERQRRQLFADITHELATPLTSIRGYAETLLDPRVSVTQEERTQYVRGLLEESRRLDLLIRDLFELARLEAGAAPLSLERLDWGALCRNTIERFEPRFRKAGLRLAWKESPGSSWIEADGHRMEQVLENLLVNALRYVPVGGTVEVTLGPSREGGRLRLRVSDDGPGIPDEELPLVFTRFYRGSAAPAQGSTPDAGGSGLGLAIVREIVERHGGTVRAEANEPRGLSIIIEIPGCS